MNRVGLTDGLIGIDTNVIVRYLIRDDEEQYAAAAALMESLTETTPGFLTSVTMAEIYWVLQRTYKIPRAVALSRIRQLLEVGVLEFDDGEGIVQALELAEEGADLADALMQTTFQQFGATAAVTFDKDASRRLGWRLLGD